MRIVFFGTPEFAAFSLKKMLESGFQVVAVVTAADKPAGRGMKLQESAVKKVALEYGLPLLQPVKLKDPAFLEELRGLKADLGVVIAFRMMPETVWSMPRMGTFNLHASLLPQYRGAAPINHALINGETKTGVTTFFLKHEIDTGDIVLQREVPVLPDDDCGVLHDRLMHEGADLVIETLRLVETGHWPEKPQVLTGTEKPAPKLNREFCMLNPEDNVQSNHNKVRGLSPYPAAWIPLTDGPMKILKTRANAGIPSVGGQVDTNLAAAGKQLYYKCQDGWLELLRIQPAGKPAMDAAAYLNGLANKKNS